MSNRLLRFAQPAAVQRAVSAMLLGSLALGGGGVELHAKDLGVHSRVYDIVEIDIRELLVASAARVDTEEIQEAVRSSAERYLDNLPRRTTSRVASTQTRWLNPSFILDDDIRAPVQNEEGEWEWVVLYRKGTSFNPLSVQRPTNAMLFFDGDDEEQVEFVAAMIEAYPSKVMPVEATGANPEKLAEQLGVPVFTVTDQMRARFQIRATPALLYPGEGAHYLELGMTEFAAPYSTTEAEQVWPSLRTPLPGGAR